MAMSLDQAAEAFRDAMRETVKQHSLWYLIKGVLLVIAGVLAIIFPVFSSAFFVLMLGWLLIISGAVQGISLIGAGKVPHFWLELISVVLALLVGFLLVRDPAQGGVRPCGWTDRLEELTSLAAFSKREPWQDIAVTALSLSVRLRRNIFPAKRFTDWQNGTMSPAT